MPKTMLNWVMATRRPRSAAGEISAMYIGDTSTRGLHHLAIEVVDNSIDEVLAGYCTEIEVILHPDHSITVTDNGRGIPVDVHPEVKRPGVEVALTMLHAGSKFGGGGYKVSGGLHGVGVSCTNALSNWLEVEVKRDGKVHYQRYERGKPATELTVLGEAKGTGTKVIFQPDDTIFDAVEFGGTSVLKEPGRVIFKAEYGKTPVSRAQARPPQGHGQGAARSGLRHPAGPRRSGDVR